MVIGMKVFIMSRTCRDKKIHANDRFDAFLDAFFVKLDSTIKVSVVGYCDSSLPICFCSSDKVGNFWQGLKE